jgi:hypothetical protein
MESDVKTLEIELMVIEMGRISNLLGTISSTSAIEENYRIDLWEVM